MVLLTLNENKKNLICMQCSFTLRSVYLGSQFSYYSPALENNMDNSAVSPLCPQLIYIERKLNYYCNEPQLTEVHFDFGIFLNYIINMEEGKESKWRNFSYSWSCAGGCRCQSCRYFGRPLICIDLVPCTCSVHVSPRGNTPLLAFSSWCL